MFGLGKKRKPADAITKLGPGQDDWLFFRQAFSNIFILGQTGAAKTTGVGAHIALGILGHPSRPAAWWACHKSSEAALALSYARAVGRMDDVMHVTPGGKYAINLLDHEVNTYGGGIESAQSLLAALMEVGTRGRQRNSSDSYWNDASDRQNAHCLTILNRAGQSCGLRQLLAFVQSLPRSPQQLQDAAWRQSSFAMKCLLAACEAHPHDAALEMAGDWFVKEYPELSEKTRSVVDSVSLNCISKLLTSKFADLLSGATTFTPEEAIRNGKIVIWDTPASVFGPPAQLASVAMKLAFQRATMRRDLSKPCRPLLLWIDESANYLTESDAAFLSQSRQFQCICCSIAQNLPLITAALGGNDVARNQAQAWISNHALIIGAANSCPDTNKFLSSLAGEERQLVYGGSSGNSQPYDLFDDWMGRTTGNVSASWNEQFRPALPPERFLELAKGGAENGYEMEAYSFQSGRRFSNGRTFIKGRWKQKF